MKTLLWDLRQQATRDAILDATRAELPAGRRADVEARQDAAGVPEGHHHDLAAVLATIDTLDVSARVQADLRDIYRILAEAEASAHGCKVDETHFHEVGNGAALHNTLGICLAVEAVNPDEIVATAVQTGAGTVRCAHGELPVPAPATAAILARGIPVCAQKLDGERCTPTSAAVILHFVDRFAVEE